MAKLLLGKRPKHFQPFPVKFVMPDGTPESIEVTYKYRTRSEFAAFLQELFDVSGQEQPANGEIDFVALFKKSASRSVDQLFDAIVEWNLDDKLSKETLTTLGDEIPAALAAMLACYSAACSEGKLGN